MKARSLRRGLPLACIIASHARAGPFSSRFWQAGSMSLAVAGCAAGARGGGAPAEARAAATSVGLGGFIRGELGRVRSLGSGPLGLGGASVPCPGRPVAPPTLAGARTRPRLRRRWNCQGLGQGTDTGS